MPIMRFNRALYAPVNAVLANDVSSRLLEHREQMFREALECPPHLTQRAHNLLFPSTVVAYCQQVVETTQRWHTCNLIAH